MQPAALADGVLHVYGVAFQELRNQVHTSLALAVASNAISLSLHTLFHLSLSFPQVMSECRERGELLGVLWDHFWSLSELRSGLRGEARLMELQERYAEALGSNERLEMDKRVLEKRVEEVRSDGLVTRMHDV